MNNSNSAPLSDIRRDFERVSPDIGDADGVVVVEREKAGSLLDLAAKKVADERERIADIVSSKSLRPKWLEGSLRAAGVLKEGDIL